MKHMLRTIMLGLALTAFGLGAADIAAADPAGELKYRKSVMKGQSAHLGAIFGILKNETANKGHLAAHAAALAHLGKAAADVFPTGSNVGDSDALPVIWEKPDAFKEQLAALAKTTADLDAAAKAGDMAAVGAAAGAVGKSCGGCHDDFRKKKQ